MEDILIDGEKIRRLRKNKGWSQMDLARIAWIDQGTISALERNAKPGIRMDTFVRLAHTLGVPSDDLFVAPDGTPVVPTDPQLDMLMQLFQKLEEEERRSVEMFMRLLISDRRKRKREVKKQAKLEQPAAAATAESKPKAQRKRRKARS